MNKSGATINCGTVLGIVLAPDADVNIAPSGVEGSNGSSGAGWIVSGKTVHNIGGEWHNIYTNMPAVNKAILNLSKTVNDRDAFAEEVFTFKLERYNPYLYLYSYNQWETLKTVNNYGGSIEFTDVDVLNTEKTCWTIYRITETGVDSSTSNSGAYTTDSKTIYAAVYSEYLPDSNSNVVYPAVYFNTFYLYDYLQRINLTPDKEIIPGANDIITDEAAFNNTYSTGVGTIIVAQKYLTGRSLKSGEFTFTLKDKQINGQSTNGTTVNQTKTNSSDGKVYFDQLRFIYNSNPYQNYYSWTNGNSIAFFSG